MDHKIPESMQIRKLDITEITGNMEDLSNKSIRELINSEDINFDYIVKTGSKGIIKNIASYLNMTNPLDWIFIVFFSFIITFILFIFDIILAYSLEFRYTLCNGENPFLNYLYWILTSIIFILLATSSGYFISIDADGSGIPEVKTVLSGINIYRYFSVEAFLAKILGLYAAIVGGNILF